MEEICAKPSKVFAVQCYLQKIDKVLETNPLKTNEACPENCWVRKTIFLLTWSLFGFHVNFSGCTNPWLVKNSCNQSELIESLTWFQPRNGSGGAARSLMRTKVNLEKGHHNQKERGLVFGRGYKSPKTTPRTFSQPFRGKGMTVWYNGINETSRFFRLW